MEKTNKKTLEEIIRVDHAGERGAIKIYEGQLLALKTFKQDEFLKRKIEEMREHEKEHYEYFDNEIKKRNIKPTKLLPLWDLMGVTLGFGTAMLGEKAAMLCTASVEEVIDGHYKDQTYKLGKDEEELKKLAREAVKDWIKSPRHKKNLLLGQLERAAIHSIVTENNRLIVTYVAYRYY